MSVGAGQAVSRGAVDTRRVDCGSREQFSRCSRAWHDANGRVRQPKWRRVFPDDCFEHGRAESSFGVVVLGDDQPSTGIAHGVNQRIPVNRFDGVHVDDAGSDSVAVQRFGRRQALMDGDAGTDERDLVVAGSQRVGAADSELRRRLVEDGVGAARGPEVTDAFSAGNEVDQGGGARRVAGIEHGRSVDGPHHGEVFQGHLGRPVGADFDAGVGPDQADVRPGDGRHADEVVGPSQECGEG